jgi:hypothetical protein
MLFMQSVDHNHFYYRTTGNVWQAANIGKVQNSGKDWQRPFIGPVKIGKGCSWNR